MTWSDKLPAADQTVRPAMVTAMFLIRNTPMRQLDISKFRWPRYDGSRVQIRSHKFVCRDARA
jgi:hypothetical protein